MAVSTEFNLQNGQRAERKLLITIAEWFAADDTEKQTPIREILGTRTEDSSVEYNPDIQTSTDVRGINYTDINKTQPQQDFDPFLILGGSKLGMFLNDIRRRNALSELTQFDVYIVTAFIGSTQDGYATEKHTGCTITYNSMGGDANVNFPISVYYSNMITLGTVDTITSDQFVFTPDGESKPEPKPKPAPETLLKVDMESGNWGSHNASDFMENITMTLSNEHDVAVGGTLKHVTNMEDLFPGEGTGNFFGFDAGSDIEGSQMTLKKNGEVAKGGYPKALDKNIIIKVGDKSEKWTLEVDDSEVLALTFNDAELATE